MINILDIVKDRAQKSRINMNAIGFLQAETQPIFLNTLS